MIAKQPCCCHDINDIIHKIIRLQNYIYYNSNPVAQIISGPFRVILKEKLLLKTNELYASIQIHLSVYTCKCVYLYNVQLSKQGIKNKGLKYFSIFTLSHYKLLKYHFKAYRILQHVTFYDTKALHVNKCQIFPDNLWDKIQSI